MSAIIDIISKEIAGLKEKGSDLFIVENQFINFSDIKCVVSEFSTSLNLNYTNIEFGPINQTINIKLILLDSFDGFILEMRLNGVVHMSVHQDSKTGNFEGELLGFRVKNWQIIDYKLELSYESF